jgi:hypothetical protein
VALCKARASFPENFQPESVIVQPVSRHGKKRTENAEDGFYFLVLRVILFCDRTAIKGKAKHLPEF